MTDKELIKSFDSTARFFLSAVDGTPCVEFKPATAWLKGTATVEQYANRIRRFKQFGW
jgi:hypothetical protein